MSEALRREVIDTCLKMNALGINQGTSGNVSVRYEAGLLITPSGVPYETLQLADIVYLELDGRVREGKLNSSSEWRFHCDILRQRPELGAVVHTHSAHATAVSMCRRDLPAAHYMVAVAGGDTIRCADYATFGTAELSRNALKALAGRKACLLANHGVIAAEVSLVKALALAVEVETLARQYLLACSLGKPVLLDAAEMQRVLTAFESYGVQPSGQQH